MQTTLTDFNNQNYDRWNCDSNKEIKKTLSLENWPRLQTISLSPLSPPNLKRRANNPELQQFAPSLELGGAEKIATHIFTYLQNEASPITDLSIFSLIGKK